jgi:hypothetical protein
MNLVSISNQFLNVSHPNFIFIIKKKINYSNWDMIFLQPLYNSNNLKKKIKIKKKSFNLFSYMLVLVNFKKNSVRVIQNNILIQFRELFPIWLFDMYFKCSYNMLNVWDWIQQYYIMYIFFYCYLIKNVMACELYIYIFISWSEGLYYHLLVYFIITKVKTNPH